MTITPEPSPGRRASPPLPPELIFIGVQINHPPLDVASVNTTEWPSAAP